MKTDDIKGLLEKFYSGESSLDEENVLRTYFKNYDVEPELEDDRQIFAMLSITEDEKAPPFDFIPPTHTMEMNSNRSMKMPWYFAIAASFGFLITGLTIGWLVGSRSSSEELMVLRQDISEIKSLTIINRLNGESASDRILAAYEVSSDNKTNAETISALINTMTMDLNVNVRIAAADALFRFGNEEIVRNGFIKALHFEKDPNLQIRLINMLVNLEEKRALPRLKEMMDNVEHMEVVRETAAHGVSQLL